MKPYFVRLGHCCVRALGSLNNKDKRLKFVKVILNLTDAIMSSPAIGVWALIATYTAQVCLLCDVWEQMQVARA